MSDPLAEFDLQQSYFELFRLPVAFDIEYDTLNACYLEWQKAVHPDRFVARGDQKQRLAVECSAFVNQAYETLNSPVLRAVYLLEVAGVSVNSDRHTVVDSAFLIQQMELRDDLVSIGDSADPKRAVEQLLSEARRMLATLEDEFVTEWSARTEEAFQKAAAITHKMHFLVKFIAEAEQMEEELPDY
ncbi:MAG: Fe-S protein assembly co-chaperone HscB [Endozoicomonadaceae bacterium]|nr:Fe-S protein assembly co-chaperone HscB [Endozoicomonadaceae bacterium]